VDVALITACYCSAEAVDRYPLHRLLAFNGSLHNLYTFSYTKRGLFLFHSCPHHLENFRISSRRLSIRSQNRQPFARWRRTQDLLATSTTSASSMGVCDRILDCPVSALFIVVCGPTVNATKRSGFTIHFAIYVSLKANTQLNTSHQARYPHLVIQQCVYKRYWVRLHGNSVVFHKRA
jgi:hypothetical protein